MFTESTFFTGGVNSVMSGFKLRDALLHTNTVLFFFFKVCIFFLQKQYVESTRVFLFKKGP